jgi:hypothetical protein
MPQLHEDIPDAIYQQDRVPPQFHNKGTSYIGDLPKSFIRSPAITTSHTHAVLLLRDAQGRQSTRAEDR